MLSGTDMLLTGAGDATDLRLPFDWRINLGQSVAAAAFHLNLSFADPYRGFSLAFHPFRTEGQSSIKGTDVTVLGSAAPGPTGSATLRSRPVVSRRASFISRVQIQ